MLPELIPRGSLPALGALVSGVFPTVHLVLDAACDLLWIATYLLVIRAGFRDRTYGIPLVAVALNFTWELVYGVMYVEGDLLARGSHLVWFLLDLVILGQLLWFGRAHQRSAGVRKYFVPVALGVVVAAFLGHLALRAQVTTTMVFPDTVGLTDAYVINLVMSVLFIGLYLTRPDGAGLSYGAAWTKCLGTAAVSVAYLGAVTLTSLPAYEVRLQSVGGGGVTVTEPVSRGTVEAIPTAPMFFVFLAGAIFFFDVLYLILLHRARMGRSHATGSPAPAMPG